MLQGCIFLNSPERKSIVQVSKRPSSQNHLMKPVVPGPMKEEDHIFIVHTTYNLNNFIYICYYISFNKIINLRMNGC